MTPYPTRILIYGDSVTVGYAASPLSLGWAGRLTTDLAGAGAVAIEADSGRRLHNDVATAEQRTALVRQFLAYEPSILWLAIGTNDALNGAWIPNAFAIAYAAVIDALHAAQPTMAIYVQSPLITIYESANILGYTIQQYRDAIAGLTTGRAWLHVIDGLDILTLSDLDDGLHPTTAGHGLYAAYVETILGV